MRKRGGQQRGQKGKKGRVKTGQESAVKQVFFDNPPKFRGQISPPKFGGYALSGDWGLEIILASQKIAIAEKSLHFQIAECELASFTTEVAENRQQRKPPKKRPKTAKK